jgi:hypothetical protein
MMLSQIIFIEAREESDLPPALRLTLSEEKFAVRMLVLLSFIFPVLSDLSGFIVRLSVGLTVRHEATNNKRMGIINIERTVFRFIQLIFCSQR